VQQLRSAVAPYDTACHPRLFEFVPLWGFPVYLTYRMRRVTCRACNGVVVERVPWSTGKDHLTDIYRCFLARCAKMLRRHQHVLLNWFRAHKQFSNGIAEGLNLKWNLTVRIAFGFRTFNALGVASFHQLARPPEPQFTHVFY
jgi:transposase